MIIDPFPQRCVISEDLGGLRVSIPPRRGWVLLFFAVWLSFWTFSGIQAGRGLLKHFSLFTAFWMIGWVFAELWVSFGILYTLAGREIIAANADALTCKKEILGLGFSRSYLAPEIRNLRFQPEMGAGRSRRASRIAFDYGAKTISFGRDVDEAESRNLISLIRSRCNVPKTPTPQESGIKFWQQQ
jgi:hypothetical protein